MRHIFVCLRLDRNFYHGSIYNGPKRDLVLKGFPSTSLLSTQLYSWILANVFLALDLLDSVFFFRKLFSSKPSQLFRAGV